jgi:hypothetical protein
MKNRAAIWGVIAVILFIALVLLPPLRTGLPKARAQRISTVNNVSSVSMTLTSTNAVSGAQRGAGK